MNSTNWLGRVSRLLPAASPKPNAEAQDASTTAEAPPAKSDLMARSTANRLEATLRQEGEALSPRLLRRAFEELQAIIDPLVSEVEGGRRAMDVAAWHAAAPQAQRRDLWLLMSEMFVADTQKTREAQARFAASVGTPDEAVPPSGEDGPA